MIKLGIPTCNYTAGEYTETSLTNVILDNSINKNVLKSWLGKQSMATNRYGSSAFSLNGKGYVCGGGNTSTLSLVECYDPLTNTWSTKASMNTPRLNSGSFVINGKGYVCGGQNGSTVLNTLEEYDEILNTWTFKATFTQTVRKDFATFVINNKGYVCGGVVNSTNTTVTNAVECYDPLTNTWSTKASMPQNRTSKMSFSINDVGYVCFGGSATELYLTSISYNYQTNTWSSISGYNENLAYGTSFVLEGYGFIVNANNNGASATITGTSRVLKYNQQLNSWTLLDQSPVEKVEACSFVIENEAYVCGGRTGATAYTNTVYMLSTVLSDVYYTTDGTDPVTIVESPVYSETLGATAIKYTEPFDLNLPAILKVRAYPTN